MSLGTQDVCHGAVILTPFRSIPGIGFIFRPSGLGGASRTFHSSDPECLCREFGGLLQLIPLWDSCHSIRLPGAPFLALCSERKGSRGCSCVSLHCHSTALGRGKGHRRSQTGRLPGVSFLSQSTRFRSLFIASVVGRGCSGPTPPRPDPDVSGHCSC